MIQGCTYCIRGSIPSKAELLHADQYVLILAIVEQSFDQDLHAKLGNPNFAAVACSYISKAGELIV